MPKYKPTKPTGKALVPMESRAGRTMEQRQSEDGWPKLHDLFLLRSEVASGAHSCALQTYFGQSFEGASQMVNQASNGKMVYVGTYYPEIV
jgi:hypothetical protein